MGFLISDFDGTEWWSEILQQTPIDFISFEKATELFRRAHCGLETDLYSCLAHIRSFKDFDP